MEKSWCLTLSSCLAKEFGIRSFVLILPFLVAVQCFCDVRVMNIVVRVINQQSLDTEL